MKKGRNKILIVDPASHHYHDKLTASLTECELISIPDKPQACEFFFHNDVDLVLIDHNNESSCLELIQYVKSLKQFVPVIVVTSNGSEELATRVFRLGAKDYFRKPFALDEVNESIKRALGMSYLKCNRRRDNVGRGLHCIHKYYSAGIKLSHAAREAGMSVSCFERKFKEKTGKTFVRYVNELRVAKAKDILKEDGVSMNDVAFACGFTNQFHFTRTFKKIAQVPPMGYKKSLRK
ncbi:MAG: DNA-binding response regulator [Nitrospirae bacterium]|nr:DNA-binding response regulator [Nitrospirota bacterium]